MPFWVHVRQLTSNNGKLLGLLCQVAFVDRESELR
jgi:hypothetical protein